MDRLPDLQRQMSGFVRSSNCPFCISAFHTASSLRGKFRTPLSLIDISASSCGSRTSTTWYFLSDWGSAIMAPNSLMLMWLMVVIWSSCPILFFPDVFQNGKKFVRIYWRLIVITKEQIFRLHAVLNYTSYHFPYANSTFYQQTLTRLSPVLCSCGDDTALTTKGKWWSTTTPYFAYVSSIMFILICKWIFIIEFDEYGSSIRHKCGVGESTS